MDGAREFTLSIAKGEHAPFRVGPFLDNPKPPVLNLFKTSILNIYPMTGAQITKLSPGSELVSKLRLVNMLSPLYPILVVIGIISVVSVFTYGFPTPRLYRLFTAINKRF